MTVDAASAAERTQADTARDTATESDALLARILASLDENKAEDIVQIDLRGKSSMGDYMVICSGRSSRQVASIAEKLVADIKADLGRSAKLEGKDTGDWVLIDTGDVIVHVFRPEVREFYQLEKMWLSPAEQAALPATQTAAS
ncbi:ribosome silencing factor [Pseudaestuariivita atlantica]|uniref:ribosome silencing factor n=1 Tax=Pseudaestuariivita atlantica TaxID=1317121 RepID=UPI0009E2B819